MSQIMKSLFKINLLYRTGNQLRRRNYHIDKQVRKILSANDPVFLEFRVNFNEATINDETQKMISAEQRLVTDLKSLCDSLKTDMFMDDTRKIIKPYPERAVSANLLNLAPQTFLLLDKIHLDATILQSFFQQRLSGTIPSQFQVKFHFIGASFYPIMVAIWSDTVNSAVQAAMFMCLSVSFLFELKRYRTVKNTEAEFVRVTKEQLAKAEEISRLTKNMESLIREYFQLRQASSTDGLLQSQQQKIFSLILELQNSLKVIVEKT
jgi:uncharacterized protein YeeX (DUF496 family)